MLGKVSSAYDTTMVATNAAENIIDTFIAIDALTEPLKALSLSRVAHKNNIAFERSVL